MITKINDMGERMKSLLEENEIKYSKEDFENENPSFNFDFNNFINKNEKKINEKIELLKKDKELERINSLIEKGVMFFNSLRNH